MKRPRNIVLASLIFITSVVLVSAIYFDYDWERHREVDVSLYFDDDPANDPNFCDRAGVNCDRPADWLTGWHIERCLHGLSYDYRIGECVVIDIDAETPPTEQTEPTEQIEPTAIMMVGQD